MSDSFFHAERAALDFDGWTAGLPEGSRSAVQHQLSLAPDKEVEKRNIANRLWLSSQTGLDLTTVDDKYELIRDGWGQQQGLPKEAYASDEQFSTTVRDRATGARDERALVNDLATKARRSVLWHQSIPADSLPDTTRWREEKKADPGFRPEKAGRYEVAFSDTQARERERFAPVMDVMNAAWQTIYTKDGSDPVAADVWAVAKKVGALPESQASLVMAGLKERAEMLPEKEKDAFFIRLGQQLGRASNSVVTSSLVEAPRQAAGQILKEGGQIGEFLGVDGAAETGVEMGDDIRRPARIMRRLTDLRNEKLDSIKSDSLAGRIAMGAVGSVPSMAVAAAVSPWALLPMFTADANSELAQTFEGQGMTPEDADRMAGNIAPIAGAAMAAVEKLTFGFSRGPAAALQRSIAAKLAGSAAVTRFGTGLAVETAEQFAQEVLQDSTPIIMAEIASKIGVPVPDQAVMARITQAASPETLGVSIIFALGGGGRMPQVEQARQLQAIGFTPEAVEAVLAAPSETARQAAFAEGLETAVVPEDAGGELREEATVRQAAADAGAIPSIRATREGFVISHEGKDIGREETSGAALETARQYSETIDTMGAEETAWLASQLDLAGEMAQRGEGEATFETEVRPGEVRTASQARLDAALAEDTDAEARLLEQSRLRARVEGADPAAVEIVQGVNRTETADRVARSVSQIFEGATPTTVIHENAHGSFKAGLAQGIFTEEGTLRIIRHVEQATGQTFLAERDDAKVGFTALDEAVSELAEAEVIGQRKNGKALAPGSINRALRSFGDLVATNDAARSKEAKGFKHFLGALRGLMKQVFRRALALRKAKAEGKLGEDYDAFIEKLLRVDTQAGHNRRVLDAVGVSVQDLATSSVRAGRNVDLAAFRDRARAEVAPGPSFSLESREVDPTKIKSILDGTYEPDADDHLQARAFERAVRQDERLRSAFGGVIPKAASVSRQSSHAQRIGAALVFELSGQKPVFFSPGGNTPPGGIKTSGGIIGINGNETVEAHLKAGHEMWHLVHSTRRAQAAKIANLIEGSASRALLDEAKRQYEQRYGEDAAVQEVAANIFATAVIEPSFWKAIGSPNAFQIAASIETFSEGGFYSEARLIEDWPAFVRGVAEIMASDVDPSFSLTSADVLERIAPRLAASGKPPKQRRQMYADAQQEVEGMARAMRHNDSLGKPTPKKEMLRSLATLDAILMQFPAEVRGKVGGFTRLASLETNKGRETFLRDRLEKLDDVLERYLRKEYTKELLDLFKRAKPAKSAPGEKPSGKMTAEAQTLLDAAQAAMTMTEPEVDARVIALDAMIASGKLTPAEEDAAEAEREIINLTGAWKEADAATMAAAVEAVETVLDDGRLARAQQKAAVRARRDQIRGQLMLATGKLGTPEEQQARFNRDTGADEKANVVARFYGRTRGGIKNFQLGLSSFEESLRYAFGETPEVTQLVDAERRAAYQYEDSVQTITEKVADWFTKQAGGALKGEELRYRLSHPSIKTGNSWGTLSEMQAMQALLMWRQEDGKRHMEAHGIDQMWIDRVGGQMSDDGRAFQAVLENLYAGEYDSLNALYRQRHGMNMPRHANYSPITVKPQQAAAGQMVSPVTGQPASGSILSPGSLRTRSKTATAEPRLDDALAVFVAHTREIEFWKAYYDVATDVQSVLGNNNLMNSVEANAGHEAVTTLRQWSTLIGQGGHRDAAAVLGANKILQGMMGRAARMALVGRVGTLLIQSTQLAAASVEMPVGAYVKRFGKLMSGQLDWGDAIRSEFVQRRFKQMPPIVQQAMQGLESTDPNRVKHTVARMGQLISGADALFTAGTYAILLDYHRGQAAGIGLTGADADTYAHAQAARSTERVAQPTRMGTRSLFENMSTHPMMKLSWAFASEARQKLSLFTWAVQSGKVDKIAKATFLTWVVGGLMAGVIRNAWRDARDDEDDDLFDDRNWSLKRLMVATLSGPFQGVPGVGGAIEQGLGLVTGTYMPNGTLLDSAGKGVKSAQRMVSGDFLDDDEPIGTALREVEAMIMGAGLFNETAASVASLIHVVRDGVAVADNFHDTADELAAKAAKDDRRVIDEFNAARKKPEDPPELKERKKERDRAKEKAKADLIRQMNRGESP